MSGPLNFGPRKAPDLARVSKIKRWATEAFGVSDEITVMVTELRCTEPGCPPLETVIALLESNAPPRRFTIHSPIAEVTEADVNALASTEGKAFLP